MKKHQAVGLVLQLTQSDQKQTVINVNHLPKKVTVTGGHSNYGHADQCEPDINLHREKAGVTPAFSLWR